MPSLSVIDVRVDIEKAMRSLQQWEQKQVPFATSLALNRTAKVARDEAKKTMARVFDRPTPWTMNSLFIKPSTKASLTVVVNVKNEKAAKGTPAINWLSPEIYGGERLHKRSEQLLAHLMPAGTFIVPGSACKLDGYGNISRGQMQAIINDLQASFDPASNATTETKAKRGRRFSKTKRGRGVYFAVREQRGRLVPGVYERFGFGFGSAVRPVLLFVRDVRYIRRFPFHKVISDTFTSRFYLEFAKAMKQATATAHA